MLSDQQFEAVWTALGERLLKCLQHAREEWNQILEAGVDEDIAEHLVLPVSEVVAARQSVSTETLLLLAMLRRARQARDELAKRLP